MIACKISWVYCLRFIFVFVFANVFFKSFVAPSFIHSFIQIADKNYDMYLTICHILWLKVKITLWTSHCFLFRGISNKFLHLRSHLLFLHMSFTFSFFFFIFIVSDYIIVIVTQHLNEWLSFYCEEWCIDIISTDLIQIGPLLLLLLWFHFAQSKNKSF